MLSLRRRRHYGGKEELSERRKRNKLLESYLYWSTEGLILLVVLRPYPVKKKRRVACYISKRKTAGEKLRSANRQISRRRNYQESL